MDTSASVSLLRADRSGRVRVPAEKKRQILEEFDRSGMSGAAFAALVGVKYQTFASWRRRRGEKPTNRRRRSRPIRFVEAQAPQPSAALELELPGQVRLRISDRSQLPLVVELMRHLHAC